MPEKFHYTTNIAKRERERERNECGMNEKTDGEVRFNSWSPGDTFCGPENGYNFPYPRLLRVKQ